MAMTGSRRWWAFGALMLGVLTIGFDTTILNVAMPTLATAIDATTGELQWMMDAYVLVFAGLILPMGVLGDRHGRKRLVVLGLVLFAIASVGATLTTSPGTLIAARALMGIGAAILTPVAIAVIPVLFGPQERGKAVAYAMMVMGLGMPLGPIVGGYLLRHFWWGSIFLVNIPIAVVAALAVAVLLPESRDPAPQRPDLVGGLLSTAGLVAFVYGVIEAPTRGWTSGPVLGTIVAGLVLLAGFVGWERRTASPMIDLRLFARSRFLWGSVAGTVVSFTLLGLLFVLPQYLQSVAGNDALNTGVRLLPIMAGLVVGAKAGEAAAARVATRIPVAVGMLIVAVGLLLGALTRADTGYGQVAGWLFVVGLGIGAGLAPAMDAVLGELPVSRSASGMALTMTLRQIGGALGVALLGSLSASVYADHLDLAGLPAPVAGVASDSVNGAVAVATRLHDAGLLADARAAYTDAMAAVLLVCAGVALVGAALTGLFLSGGGRVEPAGRLAPRQPVREQSRHGGS